MTIVPISICGDFNFFSLSIDHNSLPLNVNSPEYALLFVMDFACVLKNQSINILHSLTTVLCT